MAKKKGKGKSNDRSKKKKLEAAANACKGLVSKTASSLKKSKSLASLKNISTLSLMASRRERTTQYSMGQPSISDEVAVVRAHSPHHLSMIEEASRETLSTLESRDKGKASVDHLPGHYIIQHYDSSDVLEEYMQQGFELGSFDEATSNVGPHGQHGGQNQNTAETVLYGDWEQDNNLDDLNRCSSMFSTLMRCGVTLTREAPDTVIHYDLEGVDGAFDVSSSSSSTASYRPSAQKALAPQNATFNMGDVSEAKDWSMFQSNLVDYGPYDPSPRLPGCSAGYPFKKTWKLSDSMMMAYNAMRGPMTLPGNDPLRNWMVVKANETINKSVMESAKQIREAGQSGTSFGGKGIANTAEAHAGMSSGAQSSPSKEKNQASSLSHEQRQEMEDYAKMLKEANLAMREYAPPEMDRKPAYEVPRPRYLHMSPKYESFKFEDYIAPDVAVPESAFKQPFDPGRNFAKEYDISDDEGDPESGRLSPCTFRLLAEGCSQQNPKANQVFMAEDAQRMRPPTPLDDSYRRITIDRLAVSFELQRDMNDGGWITPCYSVESEPSIIYRAPGVTLKHKMRNWWFGLFDRMDPIAARRFRKIQFREANDPITPLETTSERSVLSSSTSSDAASAKKPYTDAEVLEALHSPTSRRVAGVAPQNAQLIISQRWQTVTRWKAQDADLVKENDKMRGAIERAKIELREIRLTVDHLLQKKAAEETALRRRRHGRILRQVSAHLHELRYEIQSKFDALKHAQTQNQSMKAELALLEWQIKNECARAEMAGPDEVRKAVSEHFREKLHALDLADCF